jgi:hypothetical protein
MYSGVFNVTEGLPSPWNVPGLYADGTHATDNTTNLNSLISWLLSSTGPTLGQGGTLEFPSAGTYAFSGTITISKDQSGTTQPYAIILRGDGQGQINAPILQQTASSDFFVVDNNTGGSQDIGGVVFQDLMLSFTTSGAAVLIDVSGGTSTDPKFVVQVWFESCEFNPAGGSITTYTDAGILITATDSNDVVDQIRFVDCYSCLWAGPGIRLAGGTNIEILGGFYSCNGTNSSPPTPDLRSGIDVNGDVNGVRITGAACNNSVYDIYLATPGSAPSTQQYGVYVADGAESLRINDCDLTNNQAAGLLVTGSAAAPQNVFVKHCDFTGSTAAVGVTTPVTNLQIVDCPGYNDQGTPVTTAVPGSPFSAASFGYYGPATFYATGSSQLTLHIAGNLVPISNGTFTLAPDQQATKLILEPGGHDWSSFLMIGQ